MSNAVAVREMIHDAEEIVRLVREGRELRYAEGQRYPWYFEAGSLADGRLVRQLARSGVLDLKPALEGGVAVLCPKTES